MIQRRLLFLRKFSLLFKQFVAYVKGDGGVVESVDYLYSKFTQAPNASILQIPTSYKTSVLYNQEPFNPSEDFDVIRNSTVTRTNQDGLLEEIGVNTPCIDYSTGEPLLLTQPQSTNLILYSEDFGQGWWTKASATVSFDSVTNPKGELGAYRLIPDNGIGSNRSVSRDFTSLTELHTLSVYAKYGGYRYFYLRTRNAPNQIAIFDFETETINLIGATISAKVTKLKDGWFKIEATLDPSVMSTVGRLYISFSMNDTIDPNSFDGDGSRFTYIWGAQFEQQTFATSYIFTDGNVATRLADLIQNAGSTDTINSEEGVLYFEGAALTNVDGVLDRTISLTDGTTDNRIFIRYDKIFNTIVFQYRKDAITLAIINLSDFQVLEINSFALAWDDEKMYAYANQVLEGEFILSDSFSANTLNTFSLNNASGQPFYAKTKELRVYKTQEDASKDLPYIIPFDADFLQSYKDFINDIRSIGGITEKKTYTDNLLKEAVNASIVNVPTSYGVGKLFNQSPNDRNEDFDVIRNSTVTRIAPNGLLEEIGVNVPCIDYVTGEPLLLTQPQSTNLIQYSEDFSQSWILTQLTGVANSGVSPNGNNNVFNLIPNTSNAQHKLVYVISSTNQRTISIFAKQNGYAKFRINTGSSGNGFANFNLENGTIPASGGTFFNNAKIEPLPNDWYRCSMTINSGGGTSNVFALIDSITDSITFPGDGISGILFWGAQTEEQPFATSYIPTNGSTVTRLGDQIINAGSTDTINSEQGVLYFEGAALTNVDGVLDRTIGLSDGTTDNRLTFKYDDTSNRVQFVYRKNLVNIAIVTINDFQVLEINSFALAWDDENLYAYINEVVVGEVALSDTFSANTLNTFNLNNGSGIGFYGKTKELRVYKSIAQAQIDLPYII